MRTLPSTMRFRAFTQDLAADSSVVSVKHDEV
jgi:hypothetical protein